MSRRLCKWWPWSKARTRAEYAALNATKEAAQLHAEAIRQAGAVEHQASRIESLNARNHFSESLTQAFGGRI